jgi:glutaredoxin
MKANHVEGQNKGKVMLYALSTCGWCKKTKALLKQLNVSYDYIDVDLLDEKEKDEIMQALRKWNPRGSFPTIVINNDLCIAGYEDAKIIKELG